MKMKMVTVSFVSRNNNDASWIADELNNLNFGVYSMGSEIRELTPKELTEIRQMVPNDILNRK